MKFNQWPKVLKLRLIFEFMNNFLYWMFLIYLTPTVIAIFGPVFAGSLLFASKSIAIVGGFLCGGLSDVFGRRTMMMIGSVMRILQFALLALAFGQSDQFIQASLIVVSQFVGMFVRIFYDTASRAMVADTIADPEDRTHVFTVFYTAANIAVVFGPIIGGIYFQQAKFLMVSLATVISVGFLVAVYFLFQETLPKSQRKHQQSVKMQVKGYSGLLKEKVLLVFFGFLLLTSILGDANFNTITPIYVVEYLGEQMSLFGFSFAPLAFLMTINGILCVTLTHPVNRLYHKLRMKPQVILAIGIGLQMLGFLCYSIDTSLTFLTIGMVIYTVGEVSGIGQISTFTLAQAGEAHRAKALALTDFVRSLGQAITPLLLIFQSVIGFNGVFALLLIFGAVAIIFVIRAYKIQERIHMCREDLAV
ncbi:MAG: MFS transporter [Culicoidibacterales bacterium]